MNYDFPRILALLRKEKGISQKKAAQELGVSQSLLSHYEKGIRECGLSFVLKASNFYDVSCDFLLGKSPNKKGTTISIKDFQEKEDVIVPNNLKITYKKKILFSSLNILIDFLDKTNNNNLIKEIFSFLFLATYRVLRIIFRINKKNKNEMFALKESIANQFAQAEMIKSETKANSIANEEIKPKTNKNFLQISTQTLEQNYPENYNALLNLIKICETKINE